MSDLSDQIEADSATVFFANRDFTTPLIWSDQTAYVYFDNDYFAVGEEGLSPQVSSNQPLVRLHLSDLPLLAVNDTVTVSGSDWVVRDIQKEDSTGDAVLVLSK